MRGRTESLVKLGALACHGGKAEMLEILVETLVNVQLVTTAIGLELKDRPRKQGSYRRPDLGNFYL